MTLSEPARRELLETIEMQRLGCELAGSPLYSAVLQRVADDVRSAGPFAGLLEPLASAPFGDAAVLRLTAALHLLVLEGVAPDLARWYPSVGGDADPDDAGLGRSLVVVAEAHRAVLEPARCAGACRRTRSVARRRSSAEYLEVAKAGLPLRILEVGASAGLNLAFDRYRYVDVDQAFGPEGSPLVFEHPWYFGAPDLSTPLEVASRSGCDPSPLDVTTHEGRQRLRSFVWADQLDRLARLDAALLAIADDPPRVERADGASWLEAQLAVPAPGTCTVVSHSIVLQYLSPADRRRAMDAIDAAGARATPQAPVAWLRLEPGGDQAELRLTEWPSGTTRLLATSSYHGPPVVWRT
ncbi:MAG: DUF2332 family protein [Acidimicrobiales bacterium]